MTGANSEPPRSLLALLLTAVCSILPFTPAAAQEAFGTPAESRRRTIELDESRVVSAAIRELSRRHGTVITYEDPVWLHESEIVDITASFPGLAQERARDGGRPILVPRIHAFRFSYDDADLLDGAIGVRNLLDRLVAEAPGWFEVRQAGNVFHVLPRSSLDATGSLVPHESPLDTIVEFPFRRRTIMETLEIILEGVNLVSEVRVDIGLAMVKPLYRLTVALGSDGRPARDLMVEALGASELMVSWVLYHDPGIGTYFFSLYVTQPTLPSRPDPPAVRW